MQVTCTVVVHLGKCMPIDQWSPTFSSPRSLTSELAKDKIYLCRMLHERPATVFTQTEFGEHEVALLIGCQQENFVTGKPPTPGNAMVVFN